jgi:hypothetical protein
MRDYAEERKMNVAVFGLVGKIKIDNVRKDTNKDSFI